MTELKCLRCGHIWQSRTKEPHVCPSCKNRLEIPPRRIVGLQIGGDVGPNDQVGMYIPMPNRPGVGVKVDISSFDPDKEIKEILEKLKNETIANKEKIISAGQDAINANGRSKKAEKISYFLTLAQGITTVAVNVQRLLEWVRVI